jgi:hypothetical protein
LNGISHLPNTSQAKKQIPDFPDLGPLEPIAASITDGMKTLAVSAVAQAATARAALDALVAEGKAVADGKSGNGGEGSAVEIGGVGTTAVVPSSTARTACDEAKSAGVTPVDEDGDGDGGGVGGSGRSTGDGDGEREVLKSKLEKMREDVGRLQLAIDTLDAENAALRRSLILNGTKMKKGQRRAVELFAEIMALREQADKAFDAEDHLPRIVVVGDQSVRDATQRIVVWHVMTEERAPRAPLHL